MAVILIVLLYFLFSGNVLSVADIKLNTETLSLKIGEKKYVSYDTINSDVKIPVMFFTDDASIASVDSSGNVVGIGSGEVYITLAYKSGILEKEKKCHVIVV